MPIRVKGLGRTQDWLRSERLAWQMSRRRRPFWSVKRETERVSSSTSSKVVPRLPGAANFHVERAGHWVPSRWKQKPGPFDFREERLHSPPNWMPSALEPHYNKQIPDSGLTLTWWDWGLPPRGCHQGNQHTPYHQILFANLLPRWCSLATQRLGLSCYCFQESLSPWTVCYNIALKEISSCF